MKPYEHIQNQKPEYASVKGFLTGNFTSAERIDKRNQCIMYELFHRTQAGQIKGFYLLSDTDFKAYHRSPKQAGYIQLSSGFYKNGELYPCYDCQFKTAEEMEKEGYPSGNYAIIA